MCLTKVYYNTYADGAQDITEKTHPCRDGRRCSHPEVRKYDRKFPFTKLGDAQPEPHRSVSDRKPTPYFPGHTSRGSKSPSPSGKRDSGLYMSGAQSAKHYDYHDAYGGYDPYGYQHSSTRHDPRDRHDRGREPRSTKRPTTNPHIVYMDREGKSSRSRSNSREYSRDIPLGLVPLADEYGRRRHSSNSRSREGSASRDNTDHHHHSSSHRRRRSDETQGYVLVDDQDERRRQRREQKARRLSSSSNTDPSTSAAGMMAGMGAAAYDPYQYVPRSYHAPTVVHQSGGDGSSSGGSAAKPKQLRWDDQVRAKRERQNAAIASRPVAGGAEVKGILKHGGESKGKGKGKARDVDDIAELRRAVERMEIPHGRDREPSGRDEWDGGWGRYEETSGRERSKRGKVYTDDRYRY